MEKIKNIASIVKSKFLSFLSLTIAVLMSLAEKVVNSIKTHDYKKDLVNIKNLLIKGKDLTIVYSKKLYEYLKTHDFKNDFINFKNVLLKGKNNFVFFVKNFKLSNYTNKQKYIAGFVIISFMITFSNDFVALSQNLVERPCKVVVVDGKETVKIPSNFSADLETQLNEYLSQKEGRSAVVASEISVKDSKGYGNEVNDLANILEDLSDEVNYNVLATDLKLDEEHFIYVNSITDVTKILDDIKKPYMDPKYSFVDFKETVSFEEKYVPVEEVLTNEEAKEILSGNRQNEKVHTVVEGDTIWDLSIANEVTVDDILYFNPGLTEETLLQIDDEIIVSNSIPAISVRTYERVTYDAVAPYDTKKVTNDKEFVTHKKVITTGVNGTKKVTADIVRDNGVETDRLIIEEVITKEPVTEVTEVGTMNTPPKKSVGSFVFPAAGRISDRFATRGGRHEGIDIANASGTPIKASDGGVVEYSGWQSGFGNLVIINHQNGYKTYYGHNSRLDVSVGQRVAQGEVIARMGTTGRSSGNHCHFEVHLNGVPQNPFNYLTN